MAYSAVHFNGDLLCAVDIETTGLKVGVHDIIQICVLPLGPDLKPSKQFFPFHLKLQPKRHDKIDWETAKITKELLSDAILHGVDPWSAVDRFEEWFKKLKLPERKRIVPIGHNYIAFDREFIIEWLGSADAYDSFFHYHARDTMTIALHLNDRADWISQPIPYAKVSQGFICSKLKLVNPKAHDAMQDAITNAEMYRRMLMSINM